LVLTADASAAIERRRLRGRLDPKWKTDRVRRTTRTVLAAVLVTVASTSTIVSASTAALAARTGAARTVCTITDPRAIGLSGLAVTDSGYVSMSDSNFDKSKIRIFYFDKSCKLLRTVGYPTSAYDPEDLAVGRDGTLYVADIGDNASQRSSIAVWRLRPGSTTPKIFRYAYPDQAHDAETMILAADDTPIFVTKDLGVGHLFVPAGPADPSGKPVPLTAAGSFRPTDLATSSGIGLGSGLLVTGGANSADRTKVALRTYSTAYEWTVVGGDVVKTITTTAPVVTPLPDEPQGEAIAYRADGRNLLTVSDLEVDPVRTPILEYPSGIRAPVAVASPSRAAPQSRTTRTVVPVPTASSGVSAATIGLIVAVAGLLLVVGAIGIVQARRRT
jgi:hypothetical protein